MEVVRGVFDQQMLCAPIPLTVFIVQNKKVYQNLKWKIWKVDNVVYLLINSNLFLKLKSGYYTE